MMLPLFLVYLDDNHLADPLFLQGLAREMRSAGTSGQRLLLIHGSGEQAERYLEGQGIFRDRSEGVLQVGSEEEAAMVDRVIRETNRTLATFFTEQVVPAVSVQGDHRRLFQVSEEGRVSTGATDWLQEIIEKGTIPIISSVAAHVERESAREIATHEAVVALSRALESEALVVVFFLRRNQATLTHEGDALREVRLEQLPGEEVLPAPDQIAHVVEAGMKVLLTNPASLCGEGTPTGTYVYR